MYEQHPFWCTGFTYWELHNEAPDLFLHLSRSDLVIFKGDLNHRKVSVAALFPTPSSHSPLPPRSPAHLRLRRTGINALRCGNRDDGERSWRAKGLLATHDQV